MKRSIDIAIAWSGLPPYAAHSIRCLLKNFSGSVAVLGTKADVPHENLEELIGSRIIWLDREEAYSWDELGLTVPKVFIHTGWAYACFNSLGKQVNSARGHRVSMIDTIWYGTFRQYIGLIVFRVVFRKWFSSVIVPGKEGRRFCSLMGMPDSKIHEGLYGASHEIYSHGPPLTDRPKRIVFVGRLIERKGVRYLLEAIREFKKANHEWEFCFVGDGELAGEINSDNLVSRVEFSNPEKVAELMRSSRFLVLPSLQENWGVVVHEAALSGCGLIVSDKVGAKTDLVNERNGIIVNSGSSADLLDGFNDIRNWDANKYQDCHATSIALGNKFGPQVFTETVRKILAELDIPQAPGADRDI